MIDSSFISPAASDTSNNYIATLKSNFKSKPKHALIILISHNYSVEVHHIDTAGAVVSGTHHLIRRNGF